MRKYIWSIVVFTVLVMGCNSEKEGIIKDDNDVITKKEKSYDMFDAIIPDYYSQEQVSKLIVSEKDGIIFHRNEFDIICKIEFTDAKLRPDNADSFFKEYLKLSIDNTFETDATNDEFSSYYQYYKGVKVDMVHYVIGYGNDKKVVSGGGYYLALEDFNVEPKISENEAIQIFADFEKDEVYLPHASLVIKEFIIKNGRQVKLVYKTFIGGKMYAHIDAITGEIVAVESAVIVD